MIYEHEETKVVTRKIEILPCPFCGSENVKPFHIDGDWGYSPSRDYVQCNSCGATSGEVKDSNSGMDLAIEKWNRRVNYETD